ncbi:MAG: hypothetical protein WDA21_02365, partial [Bacilli bacterium]
ITLLLVIALPFIFNLTIEVQNKVLDVQPDPENPGELMMGDDNLIRKVILPIMPEYKLYTSTYGYECKYQLANLIETTDPVELTDEQVLTNLFYGGIYAVYVKDANVRNDEVYISREEKNKWLDLVKLDNGEYDIYNYPQIDDTLENENITRNSVTLPAFVEYKSSTVDRGLGEVIVEIVHGIFYDENTNYWYSKGSTSSDPGVEKILGFGSKPLSGSTYNFGDAPLKTSCLPYFFTVNSIERSHYDWDIVATYDYDFIRTTYLFVLHDEDNDLNNYSLYENLSDYDLTEINGFPYYTLVEAKPNILEEYPLEGGKLIVSYLMQTFMKSNNAEYKEAIKSGGYVTLTETKAMDETNISSDKYIEYTPFISTILILGVLIVIASVTLDIALRIVKLGFLQIIAPIPVITNVVEKNYANSMLKRWVDEYIKTYVDLFLRLAMIYFVMFLLDVLLKLIDTMEFTLINIFILIGALMFLKQAPTLIGNLFKIEGMADGTFSLNPMKKLRGIPVVGKATAFGLGTLGGLRQGLFKGKLFGGALKGGLAGAKTVPFSGLDPKADYKRSAFNVGRDSVLQEITGNEKAKSGFMNRLENKLDDSLGGVNKARRKAKKEYKAAGGAQTSAQEVYDVASKRRTNAQGATATAKSTLAGSVKVADAATKNAEAAKGVAATTETLAQLASGDLSSKRSSLRSARSATAAARANRESLEHNLSGARENYEIEAEKTRKINEGIGRYQRQYEDAKRAGNEEDMRKAEEGLSALDNEKIIQMQKEVQAKASVDKISEEWGKASEEERERIQEEITAEIFEQESAKYADRKWEEAYEAYNEKYVAEDEAQDAQEEALSDFNAAEKAREKETASEKALEEASKAKAAADKRAQQAEEQVNKTDK